ncbi:MAG: YtxH domain-containing protein [Bryobacteraceae bacterium]
MAFDAEEYTSNVLWFLAGAALGATLALLFAPAPGRVTRRKIRHAGRKGLLAAERVGEDLMEKGRDMYEKGKHLADEAAELFDRGKKLVEG